MIEYLKRINRMKRILRKTALLIIRIVLSIPLLLFWCVLTLIDIPFRLFNKKLKPIVKEVQDDLKRGKK